MRADVGQGNVSVRWNDLGDDCQVTIDGVMFKATAEHLQDLYQLLDFLFGRPA